MPHLRRVFAACLLVCAPLAAEIRSLTILHVNDMHARLMPLENGHGGFAYLAAAIKHEREGCKDCILVHAGDVAQGTPVSTIFRGLPVFGIANMMGFDAGCLGNHDFDYGWPQTRNFMLAASYPIVSANIVNDRGELFTPESYVILNVNGLRVAVIGAMTDDLHNLSTPNLLQQWHTLPAVATVRKVAAEARTKSDIVVLLAHITPDEEKEILHSATEVPVMVTGHAHRGITEAASYEGRVMVRVKGYGEELGRLELKVDTEKKAPVGWSWKHIVVDSKTIEPDPQVAAAVKHWEGEVTNRVDQPLAVAKRSFTRQEVKQLIEQALREETGANFAHMNQGGVRDILPAGQLTLRHIWNIMPFDNEVVVGTFKGSELPEVVVGSQPVDPGAEYTLAVSDFTAANQSTPENLRTTGLQFPKDVGLMRDLLIDWFRKKKVLE